jgi:hypothetical protein
MAEYDITRDIDRRVRYFDGQFLREQDFIDEQRYFLDRLRRYSRFLNVAGIVDGLEVSPGPAKVTVSRGTALDRQGRQIVLPDPCEVSLAGYTQPVRLVIAYGEEEAEAQAVADGSTGNRRFVEKPYVGPDDRLPAGVRPEAALILATLTVGNNGAVTKDEAGRVYAGFRAKGALHLSGGLGQKLHLYSTGETFGIGVQSLTQYFRSEGGFAWYKGGKHDGYGGNPGEGGQTLMIIHNTNVGIGTTHPQYPQGKLEIAVAANDATTPALVVTKGRQEYLKIANDGAVAVNTPLTVQNTLTVTKQTNLKGSLTVTGELVFNNNLGRKLVLVDSDHEIGVQNTTTYFRTNWVFAWYRQGKYVPDAGQAGPNGTVQMLLAGDGGLQVMQPGKSSFAGNVGIGTSDPGNFRLRVEDGETRLGGALTVANGQTGDQIVFAYNESPTNPAGYGHVIKTRHYGGADNSRANAIDFYVWKAGDPRNGPGTLHTLSLAGGNVGIATTNPQGKLEIAVAANDTATPALVVKKGETEYLTIANDGAVAVNTIAIVNNRAVVQKTLTVKGATLAGKDFGIVGITRNNRLEFGADSSGKESSAGTIGYQTFSSDCLDIVGAGTAVANRRLKFWAEGGSTFTGPVIFNPGHLYNKTHDAELVAELLKPAYREGSFVLLPGDGVNNEAGGNWDLIALVKRSATEVYRFRLNRNNEYKASS